MNDAMMKSIQKIVKKEFDTRLQFLDQKVVDISDQVEGSVLEKVGEMLTNNIYDIIPGYAELEERVEQF